MSRPYNDVIAVAIRKGMATPSVAWDHTFNRDGDKKRRLVGAGHWPARPRIPIRSSNTIISDDDPGRRYAFVSVNVTKENDVTIFLKAWRSNVPGVKSPDL